MHQLLLKDARTPLNGLPLGDVVDEAREEPPLVELDLAHRETGGECRAVFALADHDAADTDDALLAGLAIVHEVGVVGLPIGGRHEDLHVLADELAAGIAEEAFGRRVDRVDGAALVDDDDGVGRRLGHRPQAFLALPRRSDSGGALPPIRHSRAWPCPVNPRAC